MTAFFRVIDRVLELLLFLALATMALVVFVNVVCRYWFVFSLSWGEEVALLMMVWLTYLGAAVATRDRAHFAFDYLVRNLPPGARHPVLIAGQVVFILTTLALMYWGGKVTWELSELVTAALEISQSWVYAACPVGCFFMLLYALRNLIHDLRHRAEPVVERRAS